MVEEEKMSLVWKKVEGLETLFRRREPLLLVILISLEWGLQAALVFEDETLRRRQRYYRPAPTVPKISNANSQ